MPQPAIQDVHVNRPLTNLSVAFIQDSTKFVADKVFPQVPVSKRSDLFFEYTRADWNRIEAQERAPGTESAGSGWNLTTNPYFARKYAFHKDLDDDTRANSDEPINLDSEATQFVTQNLLMLKDQLWVEQFFIAGVWATDTTPTPDWADDASDPIGDIKSAALDMEAATGFKGNVATVNPLVFNRLTQHPDVIDRIKYTQRGIVTKDILASLLDLDEIVIPRGVVNTAVEGAAETSDYIATGQNLLLSYRPPNPGLLTPSAGYTFGWTGLLGSGAFGTRIKRFRMPELESDRIEGDMAFDQVLVAADLGVFFQLTLT